MSTDGWHITSRNRANQICLRGLICGTDHDNFGTFDYLGPQLMALYGAKPIYVSIGGLCDDGPVAIPARDFASNLHVGLQQLRAIRIDLTGLSLYADLPLVSEQYDLLMRGERLLIGGPDLPIRTHRGLCELLRRSARARHDAQTVALRTLDHPRVREWCIEHTGTAAIGQDISRDRILGVYTLAQAHTIIDYETSQKRRRAS